LSKKYQIFRHIVIFYAKIYIFTTALPQ